LHQRKEGNDMHNTIVSFAIFFILGVIGGDKLPYAPLYLFSITLLVWICTFISYKKKHQKITHILILLLITLVGSLRYQLSDPVRTPDSLHRLVNNGRFNLELIVTSPVKISYGNFNFRCQVISASRDGIKTNALKGSVFVRITGKPTGQIPVYGSLIRTCAIILEHRDHFSSPWVNTKDFHLSKGIAGCLSLPPYSVQVESSKPPSYLRHFLYKIRKKLQTLLTDTHEKRTASILEALLFGDKSNLPPSIWESFQRSGTIHLLAQSGLHTGILAIVIFITASGLGINRFTTAMITITSLFVYAVMVGEKASVLRAALMISIILIGELKSKKANAFASMSVAAIILLSINPSSLFSPGFQLSFVATAGILYLNPLFSSLFSALPNSIASLISVSLSSFLVTAPLILYYFGTLSLAAPFANIFVLPLVAIIIPSAIFAIVGGLISPWLAFFFGAANYGFISLLVMINSLFASNIFPSFSTTTLPIPVILLWYIGLLIIGDKRYIAKLSGKEDEFTSSKNLKTSINNKPSGSSPAKSRPSSGTNNTSINFDDNLFYNIVNIEDSLNPLEKNLFNAKQLIFKNQGILRLAVKEAKDNLNSSTCINTNILPEKAEELLVFAECWHIAIPTYEYKPALSALLLAIEYELNNKLFNLLPPEQVTSQARGVTYQTEEVTSQTERITTQVNLTLNQQLDLLWRIATPISSNSSTDRIISIKQWIKKNAAIPANLLDATRLPLLLDHLVKQHYKKAIGQTTVSLGNFLEAKVAISGKGEYSILPLITNSLTQTKKT